MSQTLNSPLQRVILRPRFKANARTIKSTPRPWATKPKKTKAPARKSRPTRQLVMLTSNSRNNQDRKRGPWASFLSACFCLVLAWPGRLKGFLDAIKGVQSYGSTILPIILKIMLPREPTQTHSINPQSRLLEALLALDPASLARLLVYLWLQGTHQKSHSIV